MTKKELELKLNRYIKRAKYNNLLNKEVISALQKLILLFKDSDTEEFKKANYIIGELLNTRDIITTEYETGTGEFWVKQIVDKKTKT
ncbi:hypothetical protein [Clostridium bowmanii]|uniref:hypothetical protein n=1 Tax=Clostridium bowmanii TaxID=132925 RepID=UPI001C0CC983|nr:hypothetical protein [Clostridium bowmanii]MBU3192202.1 hypothetical protein [Clostridium bowmanii]